MKTLLWVHPNAWDREELSAARFAGRFRFIALDHPGLQVPERIGFRHVFTRFDVLAFIEKSVKGLSVDGIVGTDEYLACAVAATLARRLGLPGPSPEAVLLCQHKYYCRRVQQRVVPEAVPAFELVDPFRLGDTFALRFPFFVKPVRGTTSVLARRVDSFEELRAFLSFSFVERAVALKVLRPFNDLLKRYTTFPLSANYFIAEEWLQGALVTVEGFACGGRVEVVGITDSIMYPGTMSFQRFEYPSQLAASVQQRMAQIAERLVPALGLDQTLFNVEMFYREATDTIHVLEVNPRMAYQFADLYEKVDGFNTYDLQVALALGEQPRLVRGRGLYRAAASFVFRRFDDARIARVPNVTPLLSSFPDARVRLYGKPGDRLSSGQRGVESFRYAILNMGGQDRCDLFSRFDEARRHLEFTFK